MVQGIWKTTDSKTFKFRLAKHLNYDGRFLKKQSTNKGQSKKHKVSES